MRDDPSGLMWDACALLNLAATQRAAEILPALGCPSYAVERVRRGEVFYLRPLPEHDPQANLIPVDLTPLVEARLLQDVELSEAEQETFVEFAHEIDDGEARTAAVAVHRKLWVATDDRATIRHLGTLPEPVTVWTTPQWVRRWAESNPVSAEALGDALRRIQLCARFIPRRADPLRQWWDSHVTAPHR